MPVNIHGKQYAQVHERVQAFHADHQNGAITTEMLRMGDGECVFRAVVVPDVEKPESCFTGHAHELQNASQINKTSYVENCETSAIGRALASAGYGTDAAFASANEVQQAIGQQAKPPKARNFLAEKKRLLDTYGRDECMAYVNANGKPATLADVDAMEAELARRTGQ